MASLNFSKEYILEDDRVLLRPLEKRDIQNLVEISKESAIWTYFLEKGNGLENLTKYVEATLENRQMGKEYPFVVFDKVKNKYAGTTRFYEYSIAVNTIKLGHTWYGKEFRGTGLNKHCKYLLFQFSFDVLGVERVGFGAYSTNTISVAAMESVGCKKEGILRAMFPSLDGKGRTDAILMGVLRSEWESNVKVELKNKLKKS